MVDEPKKLKYKSPLTFEECVRKYEADLDMPASKAVQVDRVFVLGAGFSRAFGFTTSSEIVRGVMEYCEKFRKEPQFGQNYQWYDENYQHVLQWLESKYPNWRNNPPDLTTFVKDFFPQELPSDLAAVDPLVCHEESLSWEKNSYTEIGLKQLSPFFGLYEYHLLSFEALMCTYLFAGLGEDDVNKEWAKVIFGQLTPKDVILTFNWDVITEVLLVSVNQLFSRYEWDSNQIKLVKLHGSIDLLGDPNPKMHSDLNDNPDTFECLTPYVWRARTSDNELMRPHWGPFSRLVPPWERYNKSAILIMPPYYTLGYGYELIQFNWRKAKTALERAKEVFIVGYSLTDEDFDFQKLARSVTPSWSKSVHVHVWNPDPLVAERAKKLFGSKRVKFHRSRASDLTLTKTYFARIVAKRSCCKWIFSMKKLKSLL